MAKVAPDPAAAAEGSPSGPESPKASASAAKAAAKATDPDVLTFTYLNSLKRGQQITEQVTFRGDEGSWHIRKFTSAEGAKDMSTTRDLAGDAFRISSIHTITFEQRQGDPSLDEVSAASILYALMGLRKTITKYAKKMLKNLWAMTALVAIVWMITAALWGAFLTCQPGKSVSTLQLIIFAVQFSISGTLPNFEGSGCEPFDMSMPLNASSIYSGFTLTPVLVIALVVNGWWLNILPAKVAAKVPRSLKKKVMNRHAVGMNALDVTICARWKWQPKLYKIMVLINCFYIVLVLVFGGAVVGISDGGEFCKQYENNDTSRLKDIGEKQALLANQTSTCEALIAADVGAHIYMPCLIVARGIEADLRNMEFEHLMVREYQPATFMHPPVDPVISVPTYPETINETKICGVDDDIPDGLCSPWGKLTCSSIEPATSSDCSFPGDNCHANLTPAPTPAPVPKPPDSLPESCFKVGRPICGRYYPSYNYYLDTMPGGHGVDEHEYFGNGENDGQGSVPLQMICFISSIWAIVMCGIWATLALVWAITEYEDLVTAPRAKIDMPYYYYTILFKRKQPWTELSFRLDDTVDPFVVLDELQYARGKAAAGGAAGGGGGGAGGNAQAADGAATGPPIRMKDIYKRLTGVIALAGTIAGIVSSQM